jgi:hypothetical protein
MAKKVVWECVDQLLLNIMSNDLPFGGKAFLGLGDFRQVAPVIHHGSATYDNSIRSSDLSERFEILRLTALIRYAIRLTQTGWIGLETVCPRMRLLSTLGILPMWDLHAIADYLFMDDNLAASSECAGLF